MNNKILTLLAAMAILVACGGNDKAVRPSAVPCDCKCFTLSNENMSVTVGEDGRLYSLRTEHTQHDYAQGGYMWRLYYDALYEKEIQVVGEQQQVEVSQEGNVVTLRYPYLQTADKKLNIEVRLQVILEQDKVRFACDIANNEPHTVVREMQYPLVRNIDAPTDHKLYTCEAGGRLYDNPIGKIGRISSAPYKKPEQIFRQYDVKYGYKVFMNCFALLGEEQGLYFGSHDTTFQDTWHGLRTYKGESGEFDCLELGFYKYPHCFCGEKWSCAANVVAPYNGSWHAASDIYRRWVDTWWEYREAPEWVRTLRSWQRVIFKHQYGEYFFKYPDLYGRLKDVDRSVNSNAVFLFGWWAEGMDHGNPDYTPDESQGGDEALKEAIAKYQADGSHLLLYFNGKLIDRESRYYRSGKGPKVCRHDNTGSEILERYKFTGQGTWLGEYDQRTFAIATMMHPDWNKVLFALQDRAYALGAHSVFFDQLGYIEKESTNWDTSREFAVPDVFGIKKRMECLKLLRERCKQKSPDFALGAEATVDALAQYCDYTHGYPANDEPTRWLNFFKYTFPELVFTDRGQRDDNDVYWHVNNTVLDGQRIDIEIFRCRDLIDACPIYQAYLAEVNALKERYAATLLCGRYMDSLGFENSNKAVDARAFVAGDKMAIVVANQQREAARHSTKIAVPGYRFVEHTALRTASVSADGEKVVLGQYDMAVLLFERER